MNIILDQIKSSYGGDIYNFAIKLDCEIAEVLDLSSNINFLTPEIEMNLGEISLKIYPNYEKLIHKISLQYKISKGQIELFNGGRGAIFSLLRTLHLDDCVIYSPASLEYKKAALKFGYKTHLINRFEENGDEREVPQNALVIFANPSTPEGTFYEIENLLRFWKSKNATVLIDESYLDFTNYPSATKFLSQYENLYILKSMTKFYGAAGIRLGIVISQSCNIKYLQEFEPIWKISSFDATYLTLALEDKIFKKVSKTLTIKNNILLDKILNASLLFEKVYPSCGNFILAKLKSMSALEFQKVLLPYKIKIGDCSNFDFLDKSYVRIAVKSEEDMKRFEKAIQSINK